MIRIIKCIYVLTLIFMLCSCALFGGPPNWDYREEAINLYVKSDAQLNLYEGTPHALMICVYQFRDPNAVNQLIDERDGISKLLECDRFDPSVTNARRIVVNPGRELRKTLDRAEGTKYISIVAGYYSMGKDNVFRMVPVPVSFFTNKPKNVDLYLTLGKEGILGFRSER